MMSSEFISDYQFGKIVIQGKTYTKDVILLGKKVIPNWWRDKGHLLSKEDLKKVFEYDPDLLIIGTGHSGNMTVPKELQDELKYETLIQQTTSAVKSYNEKLKKDKKIAGAFHLTC